MQTDIEDTTMPPASAGARSRAYDERLYDAADMFDETLSPNGLIAFVGALFGSLGSMLLLRR